MTTDTKAVARYVPTSSHGGMVRIEGSGDGTYVSDSDHERVVGELSDANEELVAECREWLYKWRATENSLAASRAEAKGLSQSLTDALECEKDYLCEISELRAEVEGLRDGLSAVYQYGSDTLRGPTGETLDDRAWQRQAVLEMTNRASRTLDSGNWKGDENV